MEFTNGRVYHISDESRRYNIDWPRRRYDPLTVDKIDEIFYRTNEEFDTIMPDYEGVDLYWLFRRARDHWSFEDIADTNEFTIYTGVLSALSHALRKPLTHHGLQSAFSPYRCDDLLPDHAYDITQNMYVNRNPTHFDGMPIDYVKFYNVHDRVTELLYPIADMHPVNPYHYCEYLHALGLDDYVYPYTSCLFEDEFGPRISVNGMGYIGSSYDYETMMPGWNECNQCQLRGSHCLCGWPQPVQHQSDSDYDTDLEATSLVETLNPEYARVNTSLTSAAYNAWWWYSNSKDFFQRETIDWGLAAAQLANNFTPANFMMTLVRQLNRVFKIDILVRTLLDYLSVGFKWASELSVAKASQGFSQLLGAQPTTPSEDTNLESTSGIDMIGDFSNLGTQIFAMFERMGETPEFIATTMASIAVVTGALLMGCTTFTAEQSKPLLVRLGKCGMAAAGISRGIDAIASMINYLSDWIKEAVLYMLGKDSRNVLQQHILTWPLEDSGLFKKELLFEHIEFLVHPANIEAIKTNNDNRNLLERVIGLLADMIKKHNEEPYGLPTQTINYLTRYLTTLSEIRGRVFRYSKMPIARFVPFWVNIAGAPGTAKSTFSIKAGQNILQSLYRSGKCDVPGEETDRFFASNFSENFLTGYLGQYAVFVDDVFQDAMVGESGNSSALNLITWISNVQHLTNQAALLDKGTPFTSKIIFTSTNVKEPDRKEIVCKSALLDRIRVMAEFRWKNGVCNNCKLRDADGFCDPCQQLVDPDIGKPVDVFLLKLDSAKQHWEERRKFDNGFEFVRYIRDQYVQWYEKQTNLVKGLLADRAMADRLDSELNATSLLESLNVIKTKISDYFSSSDDNQYKTLMMNDGTGEFETTVFDVPPVDLMNPAIENSEHATKQAMNTHFQMEIYTRRTVHRHIRDWIVDCEQQLRSLRTQQSAFHKSWLHSWDVIKGSLAGKAILGLLSALSIWMMARGLKCMSTPVKGFCVNHEGAETTSRTYLPTRITRTVPTKVHIVSATSGEISDQFYSEKTDPGAHDLTTKVLAPGAIGSGVVTLMATSKQETFSFLRVKGQMILLNYHALKYARPGDKISLSFLTTSGMKEVSQYFSPENFRQIGVKDAAVYICDLSMPPARDITHHFPPDEIKMRMSRAAVVNLRSGIPFVKTDLHAEPRVGLPEVRDSHEQSYNILAAYRVAMDSSPGESGSPLVAYNTGIAQKILGIQSARGMLGITPVAYFIPIAKSELLAAEHEPIMFPSHDELIEATSLSVDLNPTDYFGKSSVEVLGLVSSSNMITQSKDSKIVPSTIFDIDKVTAEPAILDPSDERLIKSGLHGKPILDRNFAGFDKLCGSISMAILLFVTATMSRYYKVKNATRGVLRRLLNEDEMINGIPDLLTGFDMNTAPGLPWVKKRKTALTGKREWFDETVSPTGEKSYSMKEELVQAVSYREEQAKNLRRVVSISYACLKDETRPLEKIERGKTRVFICMPMDFNILVRKYFGAFVATMHAKAGSMAPSVGIDPNTGWTGLYERLHEVGDNWEDFDYSGWDNVLHPELFNQFARIVNHWYGDDDQSPAGKVRRVLVHEIVYTYIIVRQRLVLKTCGNSSGCAITAEINSVINEMIMMYCYLVARKGTAEDYYRDVRLAVYGDDVVKNVSEDAKWFDGNHIQPLVQEMGMDLTSGDKTSHTTFNYKPIEEISFLKRDFRVDGTHVWAPLKKDIIENIVQWVHKSDDIYAATQVNCDTALREAVNYGEKYFSDFQTELNERILARVEQDGRMTPLYKTYDTYVAESASAQFMPGW